MPPAPADRTSLWEELSQLAAQLAVESGALLLGKLADARTAVSTKSSLTDMVTEMDRASEAHIVRHLRAARPDDAILGEEGGDIVTGTSGIRWLIDPLDGTTNYLYRFPAWAVSIAASDTTVADPPGGGHPSPPADDDWARSCRTVVAGAVCDPTHGEVYRAVRGAGAWCNDEVLDLRHRPSPTLLTTLVGTGFPYAPAGRRRQAAVLATILPSVRDVRRGGSAALDLCWVASGRLDAYYERSLGPWDLAAGALVASEAGAPVSAIGGGPPTPGPLGSILAAHPGVAEEFAALVAAADEAASPLPW